MLRNDSNIAEPVKRQNYQLNNQLISHAASIIENKE